MAEFRLEIIPGSDNEEAVVIREHYPLDDNDREYLDENAPTPGDYLLDVYDVMSLFKALSENDYELDFDSDFDINRKMRNYVYYSKSLLTDISEMRNEELENPELCRTVINYIQNIRDYFIDENGIWAFDEPVFQMMVRNSSDESQYEKIMRVNNSIMKLLSDYRQSSDEKTINKIRHKFYYQLDKMSGLCSDQALRRRRLLQRCSKYRKYSPGAYGQLECQMILQNDLYFVYLDTVENSIADSCSKNFSDYLKNDSSSDFGDTIDSFDDTIKNKDGFGRYRGDEKGCFAILLTPADFLISLSGPFDAKDPLILKYINFPSKKIASNMNLISCIKRYILNDPVFAKAVYSEMSLPMLRYFINNDEMHKIPCLNGPEELLHAINDLDLPDNIMSSYSCCERKMFAKISATISGDSYLFARHAPCYKCKPAIKELIANNPLMNLRIFHFDSDGNPCEFDISKL